MPDRLLLVALLTLPACVEPAPLASDTRALAGCPTLFCGNTPILGASPFWELDETQKSYSPAGGFRIKRFSKSGVTLRPVVTKFALYGMTPNGTAVSANGAILEIESLAGESFEVSIAAGPAVPYYEDGADGTLLPTYRFTYTAVVGGRHGPVQDLCVKDEPDSLPPREALVFQGDRYDAATGALVAVGAAAEPWFNIACNEDALWKLALMRHVEAAQDDDHPTTADQRMAGLRSIRADYCGTNEPMTEPGVAVDWANQGGWLTLAPDQIREAVWQGSGARCVDTPRLVELDEIPCDLPACDAILDGDWTEAGSFVTYIPDPY